MAAILLTRNTKLENTYTTWTLHFFLHLRPRGGNSQRQAPVPSLTIDQPPSYASDGNLLLPLGTQRLVGVLTGSAGC